MTTRGELRRLLDVATHERRYWADSHVQAVLAALGNYLAQDDPAAVETRLPSVETVAQVIRDHRWKRVWISSVECSCGERFFGDAAADEEFHTHLATAILAALEASCRA